MDVALIGISAGIGLIEAVVEMGRHHALWHTGLRLAGDRLLWPGSVLSLGMVGLISLACFGWMSDGALVGALILVGGVMGALLIALSPLGRAAQAVAVCGGCVAILLLPDAVDLRLIGMAALGLGVGLGAVPPLLVMSGAAGSGLLQGLAQFWILIAAATWGSRLTEIWDLTPSGWTEHVPAGLAALALIAGAIPPLLGDPSASPDRKLAQAPPKSIDLPAATSGDQSKSGDLATEHAGVSDQSGLSDQPADPGSDQSSEGSSVASRSWSPLITRGLGVGVSVLLSVALIQNRLLQDHDLVVCFGIGCIGSLALFALEQRILEVRGSLSGSELLWRGVMGIVAVGGLALLALRLGGSYGSAILGLGMMAVPSRWGATAALFLAARPLVQSLLYQFDLNLSGINITHAYTYAALYIGIASVIVALCCRWVYAFKAPLRTALGLVLGSVLGTGLIGYFIHLQPQAAFLLGAMMTALVIAGLEPVFLSLVGYGAPAWLGSQGLVLIPLATFTALLTSDLTLWGTQASRVERVIVLAGVIAVAALGLVVFWIWSSLQQRNRPNHVATST